MSASSDDSDGPKRNAPRQVGMQLPETIRPALSHIHQSITRVPAAPALAPARAEERDDLWDEPSPAAQRSSQRPRVVPPGVRAIVETDAEGSPVGPCDPAGEALAGPAMYLRRLAALLGEELGLEGLGDMYAIGRERRLVLARRPSGNLVHAIADAQTDPRALLRDLHGDE